MYLVYHYIYPLYLGGNPTSPSAPSGGSSTKSSPIKEGKQEKKIIDKATAERTGESSERGSEKETVNPARVGNTVQENQAKNTQRSPSKKGPPVYPKPDLKSRMPNKGIEIIATNVPATPRASGGVDNIKKNGEISKSKDKEKPLPVKETTRAVNEDSKKSDPPQKPKRSFKGQLPSLSNNSHAEPTAENENTIVNEKPSRIVEEDIYASVPKNRVKASTSKEITHSTHLHVGQISTSGKCQKKSDDSPSSVKESSNTTFSRADADVTTDFEGEPNTSSITALPPLSNNSHAEPTAENENTIVNEKPSRIVEEDIYASVPKNRVKTTTSKEITHSTHLHVGQISTSGKCEKKSDDSPSSVKESSNTTLSRADADVAADSEGEPNTSSITADETASTLPADSKDNTGNVETDKHNSPPNTSISLPEKEKPCSIRVQNEDTSTNKREDCKQDDSGSTANKKEDGSAADTGSPVRESLLTPRSVSAKARLSYQETKVTDTKGEDKASSSFEGSEKTETASEGQRRHTLSTLPTALGHGLTGGTFMIFFIC